MAATGGELEDREITLDLNQLPIHQGSKSSRVLLLVSEEEVKLVQEGDAPPWTFSRSSTCADR